MKLRLIQAGVGGMGKAWWTNATKSSPDFDLVAIVDISDAALTEAGDALYERAVVVEFGDEAKPRAVRFVFRAGLCLGEGDEQVTLVLGDVERAVIARQRRIFEAALELGVVEV